MPSAAVCISCISIHALREEGDSAVFLQKRTFV